MYNTIELAYNKALEEKELDEYLSQFGDIYVKLDFNVKEYEEYICKHMSMLALKGELI
jgi:hypothetical protein